MCTPNEFDCEFCSKQCGCFSFTQQEETKTYDCPTFPEFPFHNEDDEY